METSIHQPEIGCEEINVSFDGTQLCALTVGQGRTIILLHSLLADQSSFEGIVGPLSKTHRVVIVSLPGFGASDPIRGGLDLVADRIARALHGLDLGSHPIFLGNGYGAFIATTLAIRHPGIAAKLVLAGCGAAFSEPGRAAFRQMSLIARERGLNAVADTAMRRLFSPEFQAEHPDLIAERKQHFLSTNPDTFHDACDALAKLDLHGDLHRITIPVMVLVGEHDEATPPDMAREMVDALPDARLCVLEGCAHVPQLQEPTAFLSAIREFIDQP